MTFSIVVRKGSRVCVGLGLFIAVIAISMMASRVRAIQTTRPNPAGTIPIEGTHWKAIELAGRPLSVDALKRDAYLLLQAGGLFSGSDGCNFISGSYQLKGDVLTFGLSRLTQMACVPEVSIEREFHAALRSGTTLRVVGTHLEMYDARRNRVAVFTAVVPPEPFIGTAPPSSHFRN